MHGRLIGNLNRAPVSVVWHTLETDTGMLPDEDRLSRRPRMPDVGLTETQQRAGCLSSSEHNRSNGERRKPAFRLPAA